MPPRRSSRAASAQPVPAQPAALKAKIAAQKPKSVAEKPRSRAATNTRKRAAPERSPSPPPKRSRGEEQNVAPKGVRAASKPRSNSAAPNGKPAPLKKAVKLNKMASVTEEKEKPVHVQKKPYFNPLPTPPEKSRPGLQLFVWGAGNCGQFGLGPDILDEIQKPRKQAWAEKQMEEGAFGEPGAGLESVAGGGMHTLFIDEKGTVWSCGLNDDAALGRITDNVPDPAKPGSFLDVDELTSVPRPIQSLLDEGFRAVQVVAGDSVCAAVSDKGDLRVWGTFRVNEGALGFANGQKHQFEPTSILTLPHKPGDAEKVSSLANGANHVLVLTTHGNIYAWGAAEQCQLGRKVLERRKIHGTVPEKVTLGTRSRKAVIIGAGVYHSFAVDDAGDVWGWGLNTMGQTGTGHDSSEDDLVQLPTKVAGLSKEELGGDTVIQIQAGQHHSLFRTQAGKVYAVGRSDAGQLGLDENDEAFKDREEPDYMATPVQVKFPDDDDDPIVHISVGLHNNMACTEDGALYSWGQGTQSELGVADVEVRTPRVIVRREGGSWAAVRTACGGQHTLGLFRKK